MNRTAVYIIAAVLAIAAIWVIWSGWDEQIAGEFNAPTKADMEPPAVP